MNRRTHKTAKHAHARQRAYEHFGISLTTEKINRIIRAIEKGNATWIDAEDDREMWKVYLNDVPMRVVYLPSNRTIITITPYNNEKGERI